MAVRFANLADIPGIVELGKAIHAESRYRTLGYDPVKLNRMFSGIISSPKGTHCCFVAEHQGQISGVMIGCVEECFFSNDRVANSILIYVDPKRRGGSTALKFIHAFRNWAVNRNAVELSLGVASGVTIDRTDRFLKRLGMQMVGGNYTLSLQPNAQSKAA
ncbi:MAG: hypothetical protein WCD07_03155 [Burkholderiales bacterium]